MTVYKVMYAFHAAEDLRSIYEYIAFTLLEPGIAKKQAQSIMEAIGKLDERPMRFRLYEKKPWHGRGLRVMPVNNYLVFYIPSKETGIVTIVRIMYGGRDIDAQLEQTEPLSDDCREEYDLSGSRPNPYFTNSEK